MPRPLLAPALFVWLLVGLLAGLLPGPAAAQDAPGLLEARAGFQTSLLREERDAEPLQPPPPELFQLVQVPTPLGPMAAYLSVAPAEGGPRPAMVWVTGGFPPGGIGSSAWTPASAANDQSAKAYREAGMRMLYPSFRGSCGNPGVQEAFYGEVDDLLAAIAFVREQPGVDPERVYLGGHSTGGTLVLLAAAAQAPVRAVIAFGPAADPSGYGAEVLPYDPTQAREARLRAPNRFLGAIRVPTWVLEGDEPPANEVDLFELEEASANPHLSFLSVEGATHFDILAPANGLLAETLAHLPADAPLVLPEKALQERYDAALEQRLAGLLARNPRNTEALSRQAGLLDRQGRKREALQVYERILAIDTDSLALFQHALLLYELGEPQRAIQSLNRYLRFNPDESLGYRARGFILLKEGQRSRALQDLTRALELNPDDARARALLHEALPSEAELLGGVCAGLFVCSLPVVFVVLLVRRNARRAKAPLRRRRRRPRADEEKATDSDEA